MKTLLVYPPFHRLHGLKNRFFPIGLGYLAGALRAKDYEVAIYNAENFDDREPLYSTRNHSETFRLFDAYQAALDNPDHYVWKEVRRVIAQQKPDIVGITTKSCMIPSAKIVGRIAKEVNPNITVVWGGPHASIAPDETMSFENVDFVVRHEGEQTIVEFVERMQSGRKDWDDIAGLVWRNSAGEVIHNPVRMNMPDIDTIPLPDKTVDLMPERYEPNHYGVMFTSRGCPWPCTFCDSRGVWTRKIRYRSAENILLEMEQLYNRHGVRDFYYWDDTFTPNRKHSLNVFQHMIDTFPKKGRPITWQATTRCDCVDDELAAKMKESGCRLLTFGIESGSPSMMQILRKGITHEKVFHAQKTLEKAGIIWDAFFMIGFPDDTPETVEETMSLIRKLKCRSVAISIFTPYPGLEIYERAKSYGLISEPIEWRYFSHQSPRNHFVKNISKERFAKIAHDCLEEIDRQNARRYYQDRLRFFVQNPHMAVHKLWRMVVRA
jgi:radical SAM superfamily enzyme YgiQ (UPF0313 family)